MTSRSSRTALAVAAALGLALAVTIVAFWTFPLPSPPGGAPPSPEAIGILHVHTTASDGGKTVSEVARIAARQELDFVWFTDHNTLDARPQEGWYRVGDHRTLALVDEEVSTPDGHFLALGLDHALAWKGRDPAALLAEAHARGALTILAHPEGPLVPWEHWNGVAPDGIEIENGDSTWRLLARHDLGRVLFAIGVLPWRPRLAAAALASVQTRALARWDDLLRSGMRVLAFGGTDAHGKIDVEWGGHWGSLPVPGYGIAMRGPHLHIPLDAPLPSAPTEARAVLTRALRAGRFYLAHDSLCSPRGFRFVVAGHLGSARPGDRIPYAAGMTAYVEVAPPSGAEVHLLLLRSGDRVAQAQGGTLSTPLAEPGVYRVEAWLRGATPWGTLELPWIFSNPIWVTSP